MKFKPNYLRCSYRGIGKKIRAAVLLSVVFPMFAHAATSIDQQNAQTTENNMVSVSQQVKTIRGVVKDAAGEPLVGVNLVIQGTSTGTVTDLDGNFNLQVPEKATLDVSYIGYVSQTISVEGQTVLSIVLAEDTKALNEVVIVGFGTQKKANLTGAVTTVKMDEALGDRPIVKAADALQGAVPGLLVGSNGNAPGANRSFQIRGAYSISNGAISPLVLIDNNEGDMGLLNPNDIESITVLKDAASTAIYGARAAGGVILITTKRPQTETKFQLNYNNNFAFTTSTNFPKQASLMNYLKAYQEAEGDQYWTLGSPSVSKWMTYLEQYRNDPTSLAIQGDGLYKDTNGAIYFLNEKDLTRNMLQTGFQQNHNLSASGGTKNLRYNLSAGWTDSDGVLITDKDTYSRANIRSFISADVTDWFTQEATLSYAKSTKTLPASTLGSIYGLRLPSFYPEGTMPEGMNTALDANLPFFTPANQIRWSNKENTKNDNPRIFLKSIVKPLKGMEMVFEYTFDKNFYDYSWYTGKTAYTTVQGGRSTTPTSDYLRKYKSGTDYNAINVYGTYSFRLGEDHSFKLMGGFNQESSSNEIVDIYSYGQAVPEVPSLGGGTTKLDAKDYYTEYAIRGGFFRLNYDYKSRYLFEANGRYDGSSKFPKSSRFGFFPSVSAGWNIADESFLKSQHNWIDMLKLRASYGTIGNQNIDPYTFVPSMTINNQYNGWLSGSNVVTAITSLPSLVSASYTWEKVTTLNVGLDYALLRNRLTGSIEWYQKETTGMLAAGMQLPAVVGASAPYQNTADMRTTGAELSVSWRDKIGKVDYRVGFNISDLQSEITRFDNNVSKSLSNWYDGYKVGQIWGYTFDGFYSVDDFQNTQSWALNDGVTKLNGYNPRPGDVKFKNLLDLDSGTLGENIITSGDVTLANPGDMKVIGNTTSRYMYGVNLGASYAGFDLSVILQGVAKRDAWIANTLTFPLYSDYKFNPLYAGTENYWKPVDAANGDYTNANPDAKFPRIYGNYGNFVSNYRTSDKYLSDASYLRIKNVTLAYSFPKHITNRLTLSSLKTFVSVENLATFSKLPEGIDPETLNWNYPSYRTVSFGINVSL